MIFVCFSLLAAYASLLVQSSCDPGNNVLEPNSALGISPGVPPASCATYTNVLSDGSLGFCNGVVNYPYYLPYGASQKYLDQLAENKTTGRNPKNAVLLSILPPSCTVHLKRTVCLAVFQACELVDVFFVDQGCTTAVCATCGNILTDPMLTFYEDNQPSYGSECSGAASKCVVGPNKVPGMGDMGWSAAKQIQAPTATWSDYCKNNYGLTYDAVSTSCRFVMPRTPCKGATCDKLWVTDTAYTPLGAPVATCPLISKNFSVELQTMLVPFYTLSPTERDIETAQQLQNALSKNYELGQSSIPLLAAFKLNPSCGAQTKPGLFDFAKLYTLETSRLDRSQAPLGLGVGYLLNARATAYGNTCHCIMNGVIDFPDVEPGLTCFNTGKTCAQLIAAAACNQGGGVAIPNPSIAFTKDTGSEMQPECKEVVNNLNQPSNATLTNFKIGFRLANESEARGMFFVPPFPGLPALATGKQNVDLCAFPNVLGTGQVYRGNDSYSCVMAKVKSAIGLIPKFIGGDPSKRGGQCRKRYLDLLCNSAHMKMQAKSLCLIPSGCAANPFAGRLSHNIPFQFALPRFPRRTMCTAFFYECAGFISTLPAASQAAIAATFNCEGLLNQDCAQNLPFGTTLNTWNCKSTLNGLPSYPEFSQKLADLNALGLVGDFTEVGGSTTSDESLTSLSSVQTCGCPFPLVVPEDPTAHTIKSGVCCAEVCEATLFKKTDVDHAINIVRIMSILSFIGTFVTCILVFRSQGFSLVFFMTFASMQWSLSLLIPSWNKDDTRDMWCKDNSQHNEQEDGGMCLFQSIWFMYWSVCSLCFWACLCWDVYQRVCKDNKKSSYIKFHLFSWFLPFFIVCVVLANDLAGYEARTYWCLFREVESDDELWVTLGLYYGTFVAIWFFGFVLIQLLIGQRKTDAFAQYKGLFGFLMAFSLIWPILWGFKYIAVGQTNNVRAGATDWVSCLLTNFAAGIADPSTSPFANVISLNKYGVANGTGCGVSYPFAPGGFVLTALALTPICLQGFILFSTIGLGLKQGTVECTGSKNQEDFQSMGAKGGAMVADNQEGTGNPKFRA